jgi:uncharacterized protein involved in response to NO
LSLSDKVLKYRRLHMTHPSQPRDPLPSSIPLFSIGFRPFFLVAGLWAAISLGLFIAILLGGVTFAPYGGALTWHIHEMLFGFLAATLTGFLLTAIPNWTGRLPLQGPALIGLTGLWVAGRIAMLMPESFTPMIAALIDWSFLVTLLLFVLREIIVGKNWRNLPISLALAMFIGGNGLIHLEVLETIPDTGLGIRLSVATFVMLLTLIGGRIIPSFTGNWLKKRNVEKLPSPIGPIDAVTMAITFGALGFWIVLPDGPLTAAFLILAGLANLIRLARWRGWHTGDEALVWVLHLGYGWISLGLLLLGASYWWSALPQSGALHALTAGAMGTMTMAVMSRATLGHTGHDLHAGTRLTLAYILVSIAAGSRIIASVWQEAAPSLLWGAAGAWILAFTIFIAVCGPLLVSRKSTGPD